MVHVCARTRNFLNAPGIHHFPSRVWLDVYYLRLRLFPEPLLRSLKSGNSPTAQTARIFTFTSQMLFFGNNLRLDGTHLSLDELFSEGRCPRTSRKDFTKREKRIGSFLCSTGFE